MNLTKRELRMNLKILENEEVELAVKYMYLVLWKMSATGMQIEISNEELARVMGISKFRMFRARSHLVKLNAIKYTKRFCPETGKKAQDVYEVIGIDDADQRGLQKDIV